MANINIKTVIGSGNTIGDGNTVRQKFASEEKSNKRYMSKSFMFEDFQVRSQALVLTGELLLSDLPTNFSSLEKSIKEIDMWIDDCIHAYKEMLPSRFSSMFCESMKKCPKQRAVIPGLINTGYELRKQTVSHVKTFIENLKYFEALIKNSDLLFNNKSPEIIEERSFMPTHQKIELLLTKLYELGDSRQHNVKLIFELNGVMTSSNEIRDLVEMLKNKRLISALQSRIIQARITAEGKLYVESKMSKSNISTSRIGPNLTNKEIITETLSHLNEIAGYNNVYESVWEDLELSEEKKKEIRSILIEQGLVTLSDNNLWTMRLTTKGIKAKSKDFNEDGTLIVKENKMLMKGEIELKDIKTGKPFVFIGSSSEGLEVAKGIKANLDHACECEIWHQGVFGLSNNTLDSLIDTASKIDFAILVLTADDLIKSKDVEVSSPRDNVVFELGLFIGTLGRERTYIVRNRDVNIKLPTDLKGVTVASFNMPINATMRSAVGTAAYEIEGCILKLGKRKK
jgi:predicted nucleotide-binding protein